MKTKAAILTGVGREWEITELELDEPRQHEVLVRWVAAGLCHTDDHLRTGDMPARLPMVGGHEGAGIVEKVGVGVSRVQVGDHVVASFTPICGKCHYCSVGQENLCDLGLHAQDGSMPEGGFRFHRGSEDIGGICVVGTFSERSVISEYSCVPIREDIPFEPAALTSCGVPTGWGSAVYAAGVQPGDTVVVVGVGGVGTNAVQGAKHAGASNIVAVDPVEFKRTSALSFGATHTAPSAAEAMPLVWEQLKPGVGADKVIVVAGVVTDEIVAQAYELVRKAGTLVITGASPFGKKTISVDGATLGLFQRRIQGTLFGGTNPLRDVHKLLDMYRGGQLKLDELITKRYTLEQVNDGYRDMLEGRIVRGVINFPDAQQAG